MKLLLTILACLVAASAGAQTIKSLGYNTTNGNIVAATNVTFTNSVGFSTNARAATRTNLGGTTVGNAVFTATNADAARSAIGAGTGDGNVSNGGEPDFETVTVQDFITALSIKDTSSDVVKINLENPSLNSDATNAILEWSATEVQLNKPLTFFGTNTAATTRTNLGLGAANNVTFSNITATGTLTATGNATLNGVGNTAPSQTASSGASLMTRELSDARYSFSQWYGANEILSGAQAVGVNPLIHGSGQGNPVSATMVTVSNANTKFMLPVDYRVSGSVKVVSYWTDRTLTNSGTNGDIAVWTLPFVVQPVSDTQTNGYVTGTQIQSTFTANYGGNPNFRYYVMEQTVNFATVTNISATNPMQLKWVELQRRGNDATDTSSDNIFLSGVHIYVP